MEATGLSAIIKWAGGKEKELPIILENAPQTISRYIEPFVGGGSVFMAFDCSEYIVNDKSEELIGLYQAIATKDQVFFDYLIAINDAWHNMLALVEKHRELCDEYLKYRSEDYTETEMKFLLLRFVSENEEELDTIIPKCFEWHRDKYFDELRNNLTHKIKRMRKIEKEKHVMPNKDIYDNVETAFMSALYMYFRAVYNDIALMRDNPILCTAMFVFIRNYSYSGMFRYNSKGEFNVPYGGIGYNHKTLDKKIAYYLSTCLQEHFNKATIKNSDFEEFFHIVQPSERDFIFLDPPYDTEFSTYAKNEFNRRDQERLADYLTSKCRAKWMLIIKYTPFIYSLYENKGLNIKRFDKKYLVSFMNRNDKVAEHLLIMNYEEGV